MPPSEQQLEPGGRDDDVGLELARPTASRMPVSVKVSMWSVTTVGAARPDRPEQVAVGHDAQPLVPRVVRAA